METSKGAMRTGASAELPASLRGGGFGLTGAATGAGGLAAVGFASAVDVGSLAAMGLGAAAGAGCFSTDGFGASMAAEGFPADVLSATTDAGGFSVDGLEASAAAGGLREAGGFTLAAVCMRFAESGADLPNGALAAGALALAAGRAAGLALDAAAARTGFLLGAEGPLAATGRALVAARLALLAVFGCALPLALRRAGAGFAAEPARAAGRLAAGLGPAFAFGRGTATRRVAVACLAGAATFLGLATACPGLATGLEADARFPLLLAGVDAFMPATSPSSTGRELGEPSTRLRVSPGSSGPAIPWTAESDPA